MNFGAPALRGISTEVIAGHYWLDEDVETDYELTRHELLVVLWFEATRGQPRFRRRWKTWAAGVEGPLWSSSSLDPGAVPLPPTRDDTYSK